MIRIIRIIRDILKYLFLIFGLIMANFSQKLIIFCLVVSLVPLILAFWLPEKKEKILAQEEAGMPVCSKKIPIGEAMTETVNILDDIYVSLQRIHQEVGLEINTATNILNSLGKEAKNCDFSVCKASCQDVGPSLTLELKALGFTIAKYPACLTICETKLGELFDIPQLERPCFGKLCPDLAPVGEIFDQSIKIIEDFGQKILKSLYCQQEGQVKPGLICAKEDLKRVEEDIVRGKENEETFISKIEFVRRKLNRAREDFEKWAMSEYDWQKVERGELTPRIFMRCYEALEAGVYWPEVWSGCQNNCKDNPFDFQCRKCLCAPISILGIPVLLLEACSRQCLGEPFASPDPEKCQVKCLNKVSAYQYSWQRAFGCKFFGACKTACQQGFTIDCQNCLCSGITVDPRYCPFSSAECNLQACREWLCGKSSLNWTLCE
ncbi:MAG: hypothetical protein QMC93_00355 [Patescibacteria group bacterium]|nr:hypothetical protein [Patescibacteria group bacterium]